jgi:crotonobetainyl-CoA:carnitine CoA-transferase CaiB-like acyl-CoA transferase
MDDLGADVIKIEPPGGSAARSMNGRDRRRPMSVGCFAAKSWTTSGRM